MSDNQEVILDNHYDNIFNCLMMIVYCLLLLLVAFEIIHSFVIFIVVIASNEIRTVIIKRIKQYYQQQPPTQKAIKIARLFHWLFGGVFIGVGVFCFYYMIVYR
ncbi:hypothetical protein LU290_09540 [Moraxella nasibovis]|uniref:hypothetical protein n=1 Tax=Moraxella nasibovis TaxID=2904120 RepID=UPI00240F4787|nr:hypothetical protein [Moraxella nasibovis]WFF38478.1 hypothetical protein LU290_09540 [Moraxella nasibovis]